MHSTVSSLIRLNHRLAFPYEPYMARRKCIFIHIPKSAGTAIRSVLGASTTKRLHLPWWVYERADRVRFSNYFKFAFARHPIDRAISAYRYLMAGGNKKDDLSLSEHISGYPSFSLFVTDLLSKRVILEHPLFRPQTSFLMNFEGYLMVDYLGYIETLVDDYRVISKRLSLPKELPLENTSKPLHNESVSEEAYRILYTIYSNDFDILGYS